MYLHVINKFMEREFEFYIVPTPIGNIKEFTFRAVEILKMVDIIACEDSRVTQKLLNHYDIKTKCISYHKFNENERVNEILKLIKSENKKMALVSDAGTPLISDPGSILIKTLRENGVKVTALSGSCAISTFLSQVPRESEEFTFVGFLPKTQAKIEEIVCKYKFSNFVFYESPNRILKTLEIIQKTRSEAKIAIGRELTKKFEEILIDKVENIVERFKKEAPLGEFVCMVYPQEIENLDEENLVEKIKKLKSQKFTPKDIASILSTLYEVNKNTVKKLLTSKIV